jgi:hypothetical protein
MAEKPKRKQKTKSKLTDKEQSERFRETARKSGADMSVDKFERLFLKVVPPKRRAKV